jgi:hypothetical protein
MASRRKDVFDWWLSSLGEALPYARPLLTKNSMPKAMPIRRVEYGPTGGPTSFFG